MNTKGATPAPKDAILRHQQLRRQGLTSAPVSPEVICTRHMTNLERRVEWMRKWHNLNAARVAA